MPPRKKAATAPTVSKDEEKSLIRKAYGQATQDLRLQYRSDFNAFMVDRCKALGVTWAPKPTKDEAVVAQFDALIAENPWLADRLPPIPGEPEGESNDDSEIWQQESVPPVMNEWDDADPVVEDPR